MVGEWGSNTMRLNLSLDDGILKATQALARELNLLHTELIYVSSAGNQVKKRKII